MGHVWSHVIVVACAWRIVFVWDRGRSGQHREICLGRGVPKHDPLRGGRNGHVNSMLETAKPLRRGYPKNGENGKAMIWDWEMAEGSKCQCILKPKLKSGIRHSKDRRSTEAGRKRDSALRERDLARSLKKALGQRTLMGRTLVDINIHGGFTSSCSC